MNWINEQTVWPWKSVMWNCERKDSLCFFQTEFQWKKNAIETSHLKNTTNFKKLWGSIASTRMWLTVYIIEYYNRQLHCFILQWQHVVAPGFHDNKYDESDFSNARDIYVAVVIVTESRWRAARHSVIADGKCQVAIAFQKIVSKSIEVVGGWGHGRGYLCNNVHGNQNFKPVTCSAFLSMVHDANVCGIHFCTAWASSLH